MIELNSLNEKLSDILGVGFEIYPFNIGWYNDYVKKVFALPRSYETLAYVVISTPNMFEQVFIPYVIKEKSHFQQFCGSELSGEANIKREVVRRENLCDKFNQNEGHGVEKFDNCEGKFIRDPIDSCMKQHISQVLQYVPSAEILHDFDIGPMRRPRVLMQTAGHVSGAVRLYRIEDVNKPNMARLYPVCLHPRYGGWFALRAIIVLPEIEIKLERKEPREPLKTKEEIENLLILYNNHWRDWRFRDVIPSVERYSKLQKEYFAAKPSDRMRIIERILKNNFDEKKQTETKS